MIDPCKGCEYLQAHARAVLLELIYSELCEVTTIDGISLFVDDRSQWHATTYLEGRCLYWARTKEEWSPTLHLAGGYASMVDAFDALQTMRRARECYVSNAVSGPSDENTGSSSGPTSDSPSPSIPSVRRSIPTVPEKQRP